jgi:DNA-binding transcriptional LysR family regulator
MTERDLFEGLPQFLAVARHASFRAAARELGVTAGAISQTIKALEARLGVLLFVRTTRNVALTEAGAQFAGRLSGVRDTVLDALRDLDDQKAEPSGTLRLCIRRTAIPLIVERALPAFRQSHPNVVIEVEVREGPIDLISEGFDAGIRIGEFLEPDMIAVRIGKRFRWIVVGSPDYLMKKGTPQTPADILSHECIRYRIAGTTAAYQWEFREGGRDLRVDPPGSTLVTDTDVLCALAARGLGLAYTSEVAARTDLRTGRLKIVLRDYMPPADSLFLYFPARSQTQPKLRAFVDCVLQSSKLPTAS